MKAIVYEYHTEIFPTTEEAKSICKIGQDAETCIFLTISGYGWECHAHNKMPIVSLIERSERGETSAQRQGCERVLAWSPLGAKGGEPQEVESAPR